MHLEDFRCIGSADLQFQGDINIFTGGNGAGKTSLLEAIHFLGRGRSFRTADNRLLIRSGAEAAYVAGVAGPTGRSRRLAVRIEGQGLGIHVNGREGLPEDLSAILPVQTIHAEISGLILGPPEARRRVLDWGVFHVEHDYLSTWRQFRRALGQRNGALRQNASGDAMDAWDRELARAAVRVDQSRRQYFQELEPAFRRFSGELLQQPTSLSYRRGWPESEELLACLETGRERDANVGYTRSGPQRADLEIGFESERSRWRASKGQQKLLGAALILAQCDLVAKRAQRRVGLLVDEPAADLDREHLGRLIRVIQTVDAQLFIASMDCQDLGLNRGAMMFHVEHGHAKALL